MKRLLHRSEQAIAIEKATPCNQGLVPFEPCGNIGKRLDNGGIDGARS